MKRTIGLLAMTISLLFLTSNSTSAQVVKPEDRPASEKSLSALVDEVRQLRAMFQRVNQTVYKTNIVVERLKLQQEQVSRLSREIDSVRESLAEVRAQTTRMKEVIARFEEEHKRGMRHPDELTGIKEEFEVVNQREVRLAQRETQLMNDLSIERSKLMELTERLNTLELELK